MLRRTSFLLPIFCVAASACVSADTEELNTNAAELGAGAELSLEWFLVQGGEEASCLDAGATQVEISFAGLQDASFRSSCFDGFALLTDLSPGNAFVSVTLLDSEGSPLVSADMGEIALVEDSTAPLGAVLLALP